MLLSTAIDEFILAKKADDLSPTSIKWYRSEMTTFARDFPNVTLDFFTASILRRCIVDLHEKESRYVGASQRPEQTGGLSHASIAGRVRALHAFFAWCEREYEIKNPMRNIKRQRVGSAAPKAASMSDFVALFNAIPDGAIGRRDRAILAFLADTGCRLGGLLSVQLDWLDLPNLKALVIEKGQRRRMVYFTDITAEVIRQWLEVRQSDSNMLWVSMYNGDPLTASGVQQMLKRLKLKAGVKGRVNPHAFRHNFARSYIENGGDLSTLARIMGHSSVTTTAAHYAVFTETELGAMHNHHSPMSNLAQSQVLIMDHENGDRRS